MASAEIFAEATEYALTQAFEPGKFEKLLHYCEGPEGRIAIARGQFLNHKKLGLLVLRATPNEDAVIYVDRRLTELCDRYVDPSRPNDYGHAMPVDSHGGMVAAGILKVPGIANTTGAPSIGEIAYPERVPYTGRLPQGIFEAKRLAA